MYTQTKSQAFEFIRKNKNVTVKELTLHLQITSAAVHRLLNKLQQEGLVAKKGTPPKVYYYIKETATPRPKLELDQKKIKTLEENYLYIDPTGQIKTGLDGFLSWMSSTKNYQKIENCVDDYLTILEEANSHKNELQMINATERFNKVFSQLHLEKVLYYDFYSLIKFGKTKMGQLLLHGKQAQDKKIIRKISDEIKNSIIKMLKQEKIDAIAWAPHSLPRKVPFLKELEKNLNLQLPTVEIIKVYKGEIPIAQKSLSKIEERIQNAKETMIVVPSHIEFKKVLLIDDAVGSGATLNEIAQKLKEKGVKSVIGFSIVGSYKGFEVIREV